MKGLPLEKHSKAAIYKIRFDQKAAFRMDVNHGFIHLVFQPFDSVSCS